jgi:hypothetical protein
MTEEYVFRMYAGGELDAARIKLKSVLAAWVAEWFPLAKATELSVTDLGVHGASVPHEKGWATCDVAAANRVAVNRRPDVLKGIAIAIAGGAAKDEPVRLPLSPVLAEIVDSALNGLVVKISGPASAVSAKDIVLAPDVQDCISSALRPGSGALLCTFKLGEIALSLILKHDLTVQYMPAKPRAVLKNQKKFAPLLSSISKREVRARLVLGHAELSVTEFVGLNAGDVVLLDRKLGQSFDLCTLGGKVLGGVQIGTQGSHIAAAIVRKS